MDHTLIGLLHRAQIRHQAIDFIRGPLVRAPVTALVHKEHVTPHRDIERGSYVIRGLELSIFRTLDLETGPRQFQQLWGRNGR